ncbi:MAG: class I SAM-dependent methyltransferase [Candidatus Hermodarchaeota archaeon]
MEFYNEVAEKYDDLVSFENRVKREANFYDSIFKKYKVKTVLDCACGTGHHVMMLKQLGYDVKGSDLSPAMLEKARANLKNIDLDVTLKIADFRFLTKTFDYKFDAVLCVGNSLPHLMSNEDLSQALAEMNTILSKNGVLIIEQRNYDKLIKEKKRFFPVSYREYEAFFYALDYGVSTITFNIININTFNQTFHIYTTEYNILKMDKLKDLFDAAGFQIIEYYEDYNFNQFNIEMSDHSILLCKKNRR